MNIETLIPETLTLSADLKAYAVGKQLTALHADKYVMQGEQSFFDLEQFAQDGHADLTPRPDLFQHSYARFIGLEYPLHDTAENVWYHVRWQEQNVQVVLITWREGDCKEAHYWIIADTQDIAREFYRRVCEWDAEVRGEVLVFDSGYWHKDEELFHAIKNATFDNLTLPPRLKQEIQDDFSQFFAAKDIYAQYRIPWKRGILLIGPPGNGKTHTVKALANWLGVACLYVKSFKVEYRNDQRNIRDVFERARKTTPCLLIMEDLDSLITDDNRSFFLNELDGFASNAGIVLLATTNHPERLDTALTNRPSRFDRKYYFELPAEMERRYYISAWNATQERDLQISEAAINTLVAATEGFSFAYIKELFLSSLMRWMSGGQAAGMAATLHEQAAVLHEQMQTMSAVAPAELTVRNKEN